MQMSNLAGPRAAIPDRTGAWGHPHTFALSIPGLPLC